MGPSRPGPQYLPAKPGTNEDDGDSVGALDSAGQCVKEGFIAHETDCSIFYACLDSGTEGRSNFTKYQFVCPPRTVFDQATVICNYPWRVTGRCRGPKPPNAVERPLGPPIELGNAI